MSEHHYKLTTTWTGNKGTGTSQSREYDRSYTVSISDKPTMHGSADPSFRGDKSKYNPEDLLLASISACHMLSFFHVCIKAGIVVTDYFDNATGNMIVNADGSGRFTSVLLNPTVTITSEANSTQIDELHKEANALCFIANSVNFPIIHNSKFVVKAISI